MGIFQIMVRTVYIYAKVPFKYIFIFCFLISFTDPPCNIMAMVMHQNKKDCIFVPFIC